MCFFLGFWSWHQPFFVLFWISELFFWKTAFRMIPNWGQDALHVRDLSRFFFGVSDVFLEPWIEGWLSTHRTGTHPETTFKQKAMLRDEYFIIDERGIAERVCDLRGVLKQPLNDRCKDGTLWDWNIYLDVGQICGNMYANKPYTHTAHFGYMNSLIHPVMARLFGEGCETSADFYNEAQISVFGCLRNGWCWFLRDQLV